MPSSGVQTCARSEEHTSELQSHDNLVCRLLLEKTSRKEIRWPVPPPPPCAALSPRAHPTRAGALGPRARRRGASAFPEGLRFLNFFFLKEGAPRKSSAFPPHAPLPI